MARQPIAIQLRYLQTLVEIGSEKNTTVVFPLPIDILTSIGRLLNPASGGDGQPRNERSIPGGLPAGAAPKES